MAAPLALITAAVKASWVVPRVSLRQLADSL
jgi:hypothetical protein